jgi:hypothetical protein
MVLMSKITYKEAKFSNVAIEAAGASNSSMAAKFST